MTLGIDYLGGANYGKRILKKHPPGWAAGFILNTNKPHWPRSNAWPVITKLAASGLCPAIRVHAVWEDNHQYAPKKHDKVIFAELERAVTLAALYPAVRLFFSPFCELDTRGRAVDELFDRLDEKAGHAVEIVNSIHRGALQGGVINEVHGKHAAPKGRYIFSFDGTQCMDQDVQAFKDKHARAELLFFWASQMNGKWSADKDKTKRNLRKAWPYPDLFDSIAAYADDASGAKLGRQHIWKTHADQHGPKRQPREGKPVLITPVSAKRVDLIATNGKLVARLPRSGNFTDGRPMYRSGQFGFQLANKARELSGSPLVRLVANGKEIGTVHPAFRAGSFR